jgi:aconitate hydratase
VFGQHWRIPWLSAGRAGSVVNFLVEVSGSGEAELELRLSPGERRVLAAGGLLADIRSGRRHQLADGRMLVDQ